MVGLQKMYFETWIQAVIKAGSGIGQERAPGMLLRHPFLRVTFKLNTWSLNVQWVRHDVVIGALNCVVSVHSKGRSLQVGPPFYHCQTQSGTCLVTSGGRD